MIMHRRNSISNTTQNIDVNIRFYMTMFSWMMHIPQSSPHENNSLDDNDQQKDYKTNS